MLIQHLDINRQEQTTPISRGDDTVEICGK